MEEEGRAVPFIQIDETGEFEVSVEAMEFLQQLGNQKVAPIVIGGPYRSGKSFLANRLLNQMKGFEVGGTVRACTKGIWLWNKLIPLKDNLFGLVMDAEGLNSVERTVETDHKLFALSVLLSSLFIYNHRSHLTENSLEDLSVVINLTQHIHIKKGDSEDGLQFHNFFPNFIWVLRDFYLDLEGRSPRDYLEENLKPVVGVVSEESMRKNTIRTAITSFFRDRDCFCLIKPVNEEERLAHIEDLAYTDLRSEFRGQMEHLVKRVFTKASPKTVKGIPITGAMYLSMACEYVNSINDGDTPEILPALDRVLHIEARKIKEQVYETFSSKLKDKLNENLFPIEQTRVTETIEGSVQEAMTSLLSKLGEILSTNESLDEIHDFQKQAKVDIDRIMDANKLISEEHCRALFQKLIECVSVGKNLSIEEIKPSLMIDYKSEWLKVQQEYAKEARGPARDEMFSELFSKVLTHFSELANNIIHIYTKNDTKMRVYLTELQSSEKRWKSIVENDEKIMKERAQEKEELMAVNNEHELKIDQLLRDLKNKENEMKNLKSIQEIEQANIKHMNETLLKEKNLEIVELQNKLDRMSEQVSDMETANQHTQNENLRNISALKNQLKINEAQMQSRKEKPAISQHQIQITTLFQNVKASLDEFKTLLSGVEDSNQLRKKIVDIQRDLNEKEFAGNKRMLELKKTSHNEMRELKLKQEAEVQVMGNEMDSYKRSNNATKEKLAQQDNQLKLLAKKFEGLTVEKELCEEQLKIKNDSMRSYESNAVLMKSNEKKVGERLQDMEMHLSKAKCDLAMEDEDREKLVDFVTELIKKLKGRRSSYREVLEGIMNEKTKSEVKALLDHYVDKK